MGLFDAFGVGGGSLSIQLQFPQVQAGSTLQGLATFTGGRRAQQITNIKVALNCTSEQMGAQGPQQRTEAVAPPMILTGPFTAQPGQSYQFPFQVQIPPGAFSSQPGLVSYRLHASADIDGEVDPGAGQEIQVVGTPYSPMGMQPGMHPGMGMQPGMHPMGMQPGMHPGMGPMQGAGVMSHGVEHGYDPAYEKAVAMKGGYDPGYQQGGYDPSYEKAVAMKGGYDPSYEKAVAMKGGYDASYEKAAAMKGGYDPSYEKAVAMKGGYDPGYDQGGGFMPGARAQAQWTDGGWYGVTIVEQRGEMVLVQWDDGTPASWVGLHQVAG